MTISDSAGEGTRWRVFISHTSELREFPAGMSYVAAVERAISATGHVIVDMADFPAAGQPTAQVCAERVQSCDVYVGVLGTRYGSLVRGNPQVSYTELEFDAATEATLDRLVFLLDTDAADVGIPVRALIDQEFAARQEAFRCRVRDSGLITGVFASPAELGQLVERSLRGLAGRDGRRAVQTASLPVRLAPRPVFMAGREGLLAELDARLTASEPQGPRLVALCGLGGAGKTSVAVEYAHRQLAQVGVCWQFPAEDPTVLAAEFAVLAAQLGARDPADARDPVASVHAVLACAPSRWLLVFDNVTDRAAVGPFVPPAGNGRVLVTTQSQHWPPGQALDVPVLDTEDATGFLVSRTGEPNRGGSPGACGQAGRAAAGLGAGRRLHASHRHHPDPVPRAIPEPGGRPAGSRRDCRAPGGRGRYPRACVVPAGEPGPRRGWAATATGVPGPRASPVVPAARRASVCRPTELTRRPRSGICWATRSQLQTRSLRCAAIPWSLRPGTAWCWFTASCRPSPAPT